MDQSLYERVFAKILMSLQECPPQLGACVSLVTHFHLVLAYPNVSIGFWHNRHPCTPLGGLLNLSDDSHVFHHFEF